MPILLIILLSIYWSFCSQSTDHSALNLLIILLSLFWWFYSHSTRILLMILLPFYGSSLPRSLIILDEGWELRWKQAGETVWPLSPTTTWFHSHSTDLSTCILLYSHSTDDSLSFYGSFYWLFYFHSTCCALLRPMDQFYWQLYSQSTYHSRYGRGDPPWTHEKMSYYPCLLLPLEWSVELEWNDQ